MSRPTPEELAAATLGRNPAAPPVVPAQRMHVPGVEITYHPDAPPPIELPEPFADGTVFAEALQKRMIAAMMDPRSYRALLEGLAAPDYKERRQWWTLGLEIILRGSDGGKSEGGLRIVVNQNVPAPAHEEGPLRIASPKQAMIEVTATPAPAKEP